MVRSRVEALGEVTCATCHGRHRPLRLRGRYGQGLILIASKYRHA